VAYGLPKEEEEATPAEGKKEEKTPA